MKTIPFYKIPDHIDNLDFDGAESDLKLHVDNHINWYESQEELYNNIEKSINAFNIDRDYYEIYAWCDISGFDYWINTMEEGNYIQITIAFKSANVPFEIIDQLREDINQAIYTFEDFESYKPMDEY